MSNEKSFTQNELYKINLSYPWNGSILNTKYTTKLSNNNTQYKLYPTGHCDLTTGRKYIYLPINQKITADIIKEHNLFI